MNLETQAFTHTHAPGKTLLKVTGIISIALNGFGAAIQFLVVSGFMTIGLLLSLFGARLGGNLPVALAQLLFAGYGLFMGIIAVMKCKDLTKAQLLQILALIHLALTGLHIVLTHILVVFPPGMGLEMGSLIGAILLGIVAGVDVARDQSAIGLHFSSGKH